MKIGGPKRVRVREIVPNREVGAFNPLPMYNYEVDQWSVRLHHVPVVVGQNLLLLKRNCLGRKGAITSSDEIFCY